MTAYLALDIQTGPCLDQQVCYVAVTIIRSQHERSVAILYQEWTRGGQRRSDRLPCRRRGGTGQTREGRERGG